MKFYVLKTILGFDETNAVTDFLQVEPFHTGEATKCPVCNRFISALTWLPPRRAEMETLGTVYCDIASSTGDDLMVSDRFVELYRQSKLIGLEGFDPVEIVKIKRRKKIFELPPRYFRVSAARSRMAIDMAASGFEWDNSSQICPECRSDGLLKRWRRIVFEEPTWSGEDIFIARGLTGTYFASDRFKIFCEQNQMRNAVFVPIEKYAKDFYPSERL